MNDPANVRGSSIDPRMIRRPRVARSARRKEGLSNSAFVLGVVALGALLISGVGIGFIIGMTQEPPRRFAHKERRPEIFPPIEEGPEPALKLTEKEPVRSVSAPTVKAPVPPNNSKPEPPKSTPPKSTPPKPKNDPPTRPTMPEKPVVALSFQDKIRPIFESKCIVCHGDPLRKGGLDLRTLKTTLKGGDGGVGVKPGVLADSAIWSSIDHGEMPPPNKRQLTEAEKTLIRTWIEQGAH